MSKKCERCGCELTGWYLIYKGKYFCRKKDDACLKNHLFEEADEEITEDKDFSGDYRMDYVTWMEDRGFD